MRRKVIRHGGSTLTVSIPQKWAKRYGVKKGDELIIKEKGSRLIIETEESGEQITKKTVSVDTYDRVGMAYLLGCYRNGADELTLNYSNPEYIETIQNIVGAKMKGFEIIKQESNSCVVRDLLGIEKGDFDIALRRLWMLLLSVTEDFLEAIKKSDYTTIQGIPKRDTSINSFANYCARIIAKKGMGQKNNCTRYFMVTMLEEIGDQYKEASRYFLESKPSLSKETLRTFNKVNSYLRKLYELTYKFDKEKTEELFTGTLTTPEKIKSLLIIKDDDGVVLGHLLNVCEHIRSILAINVELILNE